MATEPYSLTTLDSVKSFMGKLGTDGNDDLIERLIDRVSALFESYMDINILSREYTEYYDGSGIDTLFTNQYPVTTISGIWDDSDWVWSSANLIDSNNYRIADENRIVFKSTTLSDQKQNVKIIYMAGYATVPYDLVEACVEEVARIHKNKSHIDVTAVTLPDGSRSYTAKDFLPKTLTVLNHYRRKAAI